MGYQRGIPQETVFYSEGFFGYGSEGGFVQRSPAHFVPIPLAIGAIALTWAFRKRLRAWRHEETARFPCVPTMLLVTMSYCWRLLYVGVGADGSNALMDRLPLQICEWTLVICCFMMLKRSALLFEMAFFLAMSFSLLPLLFPAVITDAGPTHYRYHQFRLEHLLPVHGMSYMMFAHKMKPRPRGVIAAIAMPAALTVPAPYLNQSFETANCLHLKPGALDMISFLPNSLLPLVALCLGAVLALMGIDWLVWKLATRSWKRT